MPFPFDHKYPGTDLHEIDLGYLIEEIKNIRIELKNFADINKIHYANPLEWSITTQYPPFTIVRDANNNNLYISMQPVPEGISLDNGEFWQMIGPYSGESDFLKWVICQNYEPDYTRATQAYAKNTYFWGADNNLYRVTRAVPAGGSFGPSNCTAITIAAELTALHNKDADLQDQINNVSIDTSDMMPVRSHRKYILLCDSYGVTFGNETGIEAWVRRFVGMTSANSWTYPHSSARFGPHYPSEGTSYKNMLMEYNSSIPKEEITDIIIQTAGNDMSETTADWQDAIDDFITYALSQFPNAQIRVAFTLFAYVRQSRQAKYAFCNAMQSYIVEHANISWMAGIEIADKDYSQYRNSTHPNGTGNRWFAEAIANSILGEGPAYHIQSGKRAYFTQSGTNDVTAWDSNGGIVSIYMGQLTAIRFASNVFTLAPITISPPASYGDNWRTSAAIDLGAIDDNRFFGSPQATVIFPMNNTYVMFNSLEGHSNQWRSCDTAYVYFEDVNKECHAFLRFYISNPGGPDTTETLTISKLRFDNSDHVVASMYV